MSRFVVHCNHEGGDRQVVVGGAAGPFHLAEAVPSVVGVAEEPIVGEISGGVNDTASSAWRLKKPAAVGASPGRFGRPFCVQELRVETLDLLVHESHVEYGGESAAAGAAETLSKLGTSQESQDRRGETLDLFGR